MPSWNRVAGTASGLVLALRNLYLGGEVSLFGVLGAPARVSPMSTEVEGWLLQVGAQGSLGRVSGVVCQGPGFCATRGAAGLAVKGGWGRGVPHREGRTIPEWLLYAQLDLLAGYLDLPSAPLVPSASSWEFVGRLRLGAQFSEPGRSLFPSWGRINAALVIEVVPVSRAASGVSVGGVLGIAF